MFLLQHHPSIDQTILELPSMMLGSVAMGTTPLCLPMTCPRKSNFLGWPCLECPTLFSRFRFMVGPSFLQRFRDSSSTLKWCINLLKGKNSSRINFARQSFHDGGSLVTMELTWKFSSKNIPEAITESAILLSIWTCSRTDIPSTISKWMYWWTSDLFAPKSSLKANLSSSHSSLAV